MEIDKKMTNKKFKASKGAISIIRKNIQRYGTELERIREECGNITAEVVVEESKNKNSVLHDYFEWDDEKASNNWRLTQARNLISHVEVIITTPKGQKNYKAFYSINTTDDEKLKNRAYVSIEQVMSNKGLKEQIVKQALKEAIYWEEKYKQYKELNMIFKAIEKTDKKFGVRWME